MMPQYFGDSYATGPGAYPPLMPAYTMESTPGASSSSAQRYMKTEGAQSPVRAPPPIASTSTAPATSPVLAPSTTTRHRPSGDGAQAQHSGGKSSLSAITAPYHPDPAPPPTAASSSLPSGMPAPPAQPPTQSKKLPRADAHPGRASAPQGGRRPGEFYGGGGGGAAGGGMGSGGSGGGDSYEYDAPAGSPGAGGSGGGAGGDRGGTGFGRSVYRRQESRDEERDRLGAFHSVRGR